MKRASKARRIGCVTALWLCGCLNPAKERAERDESIGYAQAERLRLEVVDGLAQIRSFDEDTVVLWNSAPGIELIFSGITPPRSLRLELQNAMSLGELGLDEGDGAIRPIGGDIGTRKLYDVTLTSERVLLSFRVPESERFASFRFGLLSDVQEAIGRVQDIFAAINREPSIEFVLGAGDLTEQGSEAELRRFQRELRSLTVPYYTTLGNHELGDSPFNYQRFFGRVSYSFEHRGVRFTLLDSASATIDSRVYRSLEEWLRLGQTEPHVVAMHIPPLDPTGVRNGAFASRSEAAKLLGRLAAGEVDLTLYGHIHSYYSFFNAGIEAHISGGGGALPERFDGIGRHFLVVEHEAGRFKTQIARVD